MPARSEFFKRADFGRKRAEIGCFRRGSPIMRAADRKGTSKLVAPHELSSKFLLRMRGEGCPVALASLDQQAFLRQVFGAVRSITIATESFSSDRFAGRRSVYWTRNETQAIAAGDRATR